jgi:predicted nucleic acid-binding Zn ribbon protein
MNCTNCNTWNPDDKEVCWRCQAVLPKPKPKKEKKPMVFAGLPVWMWVAMIVFIATLFLGQCMMLGPAQ